MPVPQYPVFEAALTGRATLEGATVAPVAEGETWGNAKSLLDVAPQSAAELDAIRAAVVEQEGLLSSIFDVLRKVPRRVLMVFKLNDLTRSLDNALATTHSNVCAGAGTF
jgi:aarF domain-containing kinase